MCLKEMPKEFVSGLPMEDGPVAATEESQLQKQKIFAYGLSGREEEVLLEYGMIKSEDIVVNFEQLKELENKVFLIGHLSDEEVISLGKKEFINYVPIEENGKVELVLMVKKYYHMPQLSL